VRGLAEAGVKGASAQTLRMRRWRTYIEHHFQCKWEYSAYLSTCTIADHLQRWPTQQAFGDAFVGRDLTRRTRLAGDDCHDHRRIEGNQMYVPLPTICKRDGGRFRRARAAGLPHCACLALCGLTVSYRAMQVLAGSALTNTQ
jgi:hypothetical protein